MSIFHILKIKQLKNMDQTMRPIHCTDQKRKSMFVKENGVWGRDTNNKLLNAAVGNINTKQFKAYSKHHQTHPNWTKNDDVAFDLRNQMTIHMCGYMESTKDNLNAKVVKLIAQNTFLHRDI